MQPSPSLGAPIELPMAAARRRHTVLQQIRELGGRGLPTHATPHPTSGPRDVPAATTMSLEQDEILMLLCAVNTSPLRHASTCRRTLRRALAKILAGQSAAVRDQVAQWPNLIESCGRPCALPQEAAHHFSRLLKAMVQQVYVRLQCTRPADAWAPFEIAPFRLVGTEEAWMVLGRSLQHRRIVRVDLQQIATVTTQKKRYRMPATLPDLQAVAAVDDIKPPLPRHADG